MEGEKRKTTIKNSKLLRFTLWFYVFSFSLSAYLSGSACWAVTSKVTRHSSKILWLAHKERSSSAGRGRRRSSSSRTFGR